ncbi:unnamed protein product [Protopolystoma xenopodis]|uniref:Uncharacterized protein n=1 Tax=Protopolystoma xenopodis TaxID=117903 RepID=A0A448WYM4_9PLAT|nr:unnamed protein product [Protopolystoma xenopodis]
MIADFLVYVRQLTVTLETEEPNVKRLAEEIDCSNDVNSSQKVKLYRLLINGVHSLHEARELLSHLNSRKGSSLDPSGIRLLPLISSYEITKQRLIKKALLSHLISLGHVAGEASFYTDPEYDFDPAVKNERLAKEITFARIKPEEDRTMPLPSDRVPVFSNMLGFITALIEALINFDAMVDEYFQFSDMPAC